MRTMLYLMRHGIAEDRAPLSGLDRDRALTSEGVTKTRLVATGLREVGVLPQRILSSPYLRSRQTAEIVRDQCCPRVEVEIVEELQVETTMRAMEELLLSLMGKGDALCVGHEPSMGRATSWLACGDSSQSWMLKRAAVAAFETEGGSHPSARLLWYAPPRILIRHKEV